MEEADGNDADLFAAGDEPVDGFDDRLDAAAHRDDHPLRFRMPVIVEQMVTPAGDRGQFVHGRLHGVRQLVVKTVHGLPALEIHVGILRGAAERRPVRRHRPGAERRDVIFVDHGA